MALDRDLGVALVAAAEPDRRDLVGAELFAATGVRGLRLLLESGRFARFASLERNPEAVAVLARNVAGRGAAGARALRGDARRPPLKTGLDYVDLDPFGTPEPFLRDGVRLLRPGGLLGITATDLPVLTGVARGAALRRYGGRPIRGRLGPEGGLRILLARLVEVASEEDRRVGVVAAYVQDHHLRVVARVHAGRDPAPSIGSLEPATFPGPELPEGGPYGPMWLGPLFDPVVAGRLTVPERAERPRECERWTRTFREEARIVAPFYYEPNEIARALHLASPPAPDRIVEILRTAGYPAARTHVRDGAVRSPASRAEVHRLLG